MNSRGTRAPGVPAARIAALVWGLLVAAAALTGCRRTRVADLGGVTAPGKGAGYNVLLVTIDTARRDHFGCYGDKAARTPTIDALAAAGVLVDDAVTSVPLTLPSHTTLLTGLQPDHHGVHDNGIAALDSGVTTLPVALHAHGYATGAFVSAFVLDARFGLARGFDVYDFQVSREGYRPRMPDFNERSAAAVTDAALAWLRQRPAGRPFFAWVHYFDPHRPYHSPLASQPIFAHRPYDAEIAYVDQQLARIIRWLQTTGRADRTLVVVTADHGESLGEHREQTHGMFLYDATIRVPLILWSPSLLPGPLRLTGRSVGLVDLRATIEDLLGLPTAAPTDGRSLLRPIPADRLLYLETEAPLRMAGCSPLHGLRGHGLKFIQAPEPELYDLRRDPAETHNLITARRAGADTLADRLARRLAGSGGAAPRPSRSLTAEEELRLRSLGYTFHAPSGQHDRLPDPKDRITAFNRGMAAEGLYGRGDYAGAARLARRVLDACDGCINAARVLAFSLLRQGHADSAVALLRAQTARHPDDTFLVRSLVEALLLAGDTGAALRELDVYAALAPGDGRVELLRGDCLARQGDRDGALAHYQRALAVDPNRVGPRARSRITRLRESAQAPAR